MVAIRLACDCIGVLERMSDPGIMLFGKTIQLEPNDNVSHAIDAAVVNCEQSLCDHNSINCHKDTASGEGSTDSKHEDGCIRAVLEDQTRCEDKEWSSSKRPKKEEEEEEEEENETRGPEENPLKKPDKILPCPRCNSIDTKFCYFNNYNLSQPRHFCKNCQRYWTAGGTMRNMPVGAGRRKNKTTNSSSGPRYIVIPNTVHPPFRVNTFASESPLSESITSNLTIEEDAVRAKGGPYFTAPPWTNPWTTLSCHVPIYVMPTYWSCESQPHCPSTSSGASSPLGKHPREEKERSDGEDKRAETKVLVPKTLRFDDPSEAAKSSIWTTLGIKHENTGSLDSGIFFRGLQSKGSHISSGYEMSSVLQANPAAMSRSLTYHESVE